MRERDAGQLGQSRFKTLKADMVVVIDLAFNARITATLFGLEGPLRAALRGDLCREGWCWQDADEAAETVLASALEEVGAVRPPWNEGQSEWAISSGDLLERTRCVNCHGPLPEERTKYCSDQCRKTHNLRLMRLREAQEGAALSLAGRSMIST